MISIKILYCHVKVVFWNTVDLNYVYEHYNLVREADMKIIIENEKKSRFLFRANVLKIKILKCFLNNCRIRQVIQCLDIFKSSFLLL